MKKIIFYVSTGLLLGCLSSCGHKEAVQTNKEVSAEQPAVKVELVDATNDPLGALKTGNERFYAGKSLHIHQDSARIKELTSGQHPFVVIVSCSDSRVSPEILFDQGLGDIFSIRTAGNVMSDYELGSVEYAAEHLGTKLIVVMGHEGCGAVKAFLEHEKDKKTPVPGHIQSIIKALESETEEQEALKDSDNVLSKAVRANVQHAIKQLKSSQPILKEMEENGKITIIGAVYHIEDGKVEFLQ